MQFWNRKCVGYAGNYFCFPISLTDAEILGIWVSEIQAVQLRHWPCAWLLGPTEGALQWRRATQQGQQARCLWRHLHRRLGQPELLLTNIKMKHNPIFLHYREETASLQPSLSTSSFLRKSVSITVVSLRLRDAPLLSLLVYIWNVLPFVPSPSSGLFKPQLDYILLSTLFSNYTWSHPIIFFFFSDFSIFCYTSKWPCGSVSVIDHKYFF